MCGVPSVLWGLPWMQQGQRYGRQTVGHYRNSSNRHTELYICSATGPEVPQSDNTREQDFGTRKFYCVYNVTFHAEFKYAIILSPSLTVFVQWHFLLSIFRILGILSVILLYVNQYFIWFWTEDGHKQFSIIKSLAVWPQKQEVNETNVELWRWTICWVMQNDAL